MKAKKSKHITDTKKKSKFPVKKHHLSHPGILFLGALLVSGVVGWMIAYAYRTELYDLVMSTMN